MSYILAIDQSTAGTKGTIFDGDGRLVARCDLPHKQITNHLGYVEHDPTEIYRNTVAVTKNVLEKSGVSGRELAGVGISNQRESVLCWDRLTGLPLHNVVVWQCGRAVSLCDELAKHQAFIREKSGLMLSAFFSGPKILWLLRNVAGLKEKLENGTACFGTIDSWLVYCLTHGKEFKTDVSNASRTMLMNIDSLQWDGGLLDLMELREESLPQIVPSDSAFGYTDFDGVLEREIPILAVLGDSHAALFANGAVRPGMAKATFGTGSSVMLNVGKKRPSPSDGVVSSVAWQRNGGVDYVLEGNINYTGAVIKWLAEDLRLIEHARDAGIISAEVESTEGVYLVPAFSGLGAPHWNHEARAMLCGMSQATQRAHIVRAAEESIAYQIRDVVEAMNRGTGERLKSIFADGGPTKDPFLMQFVSDMLGIPVWVSGIEEMSAAGVAYLAAISAGISSEESIMAGRKTTLFEPKMAEATRCGLYRGWREAVQMLVHGGG